VASEKRNRRKKIHRLDGFSVIFREKMLQESMMSPFQRVLNYCPKNVGSRVKGSIKVKF
jgi:hypothetical protein